MTQYTLAIYTHGICTHFTNGVVSSVPHRVVLPDTTHIQAGTLTLESQTPPAPLLYYLIPHFPRLVFPDGREPAIPGLLAQGNLLMGARLQVPNCTDQGIVYDDDGGTRLSTYYPDYTPSDDVVMNGRAACYLDVYGGHVTFVPSPKPLAPGYFVITMQTEGLPELLVTPLAQTPLAQTPASPSNPNAPRPGAPSYRVKIVDHHEDPTVPILLRLLNVELMPEQPAEELFGAFDYMLHYLTARGGIPASIPGPAPGMPRKGLRSVTSERMADALRTLADMIATAKDPGAPGSASPLGYVDPLKTVDYLNEACAPSQYP